MNHEYRNKIANESWIIRVKKGRNHEYRRSNDSASTPDKIANVVWWKQGLQLFALVWRKKYTALRLNFITVPRVLKSMTCLVICGYWISKARETQVVKLCPSPLERKNIRGRGIKVGKNLHWGNGYFLEPHISVYLRAQNTSFLKLYYSIKNFSPLEMYNYELTLKLWTRMSDNANTTILYYYYSKTLWYAAGLSQVSICIQTLIVFFVFFFFLTRPSLYIPTFPRLFALFLVWHKKICSLATKCHYST